MAELVKRSQCWEYHPIPLFCKLNKKYDDDNDDNNDELTGEDSEDSSLIDIDENETQDLPKLK